MAAWCHSSPQSGPSRQTATANTMRARPIRPNTSSIWLKRTCHNTTQTANPTIGIQRNAFTLVASVSASDTPPISAMKVMNVTAMEPSRLARPARDRTARRPPHS